MAFQLDSNILLSGRGPNVAGAVQQGLNTRSMFDTLREEREQAPIRKKMLENQQIVAQQVQEENARKAQQADQDSVIGSIASSWAGVKGLVDAGKFNEAADVLEANKKNLIDSGAKNLDDTNLGIQALRSGDAKQINAIKLQGNEAIRLATERGLNATKKPLTENQRQTINLKKEGLKIRKSESELRKLDQQLKQEENALKREDLNLKIEQKKKVIEQEKLDVLAKAEDSVSQVNSTLETIDRVRNHPGLESSAGVFAGLPTFSGTDAADFEAQLETLQSQQFLSAVSQMKGMGALSENEGKKLASSIGALNISMSDKALKTELDRIYEVTAKARDKMAARLPKKEAESNQGDQGDQDTGVTAEQFRQMTPEQRAAVLQERRGVR
jgi:hypothetical protein